MIFVQSDSWSCNQELNALHLYKQQNPNSAEEMQQADCGMLWWWASDHQETSLLSKWYINVLRCSKNHPLSTQWSINLAWRILEYFSAHKLQKALKALLGFSFPHFFLNHWKYKHSPLSWSVLLLNMFWNTWIWKNKCTVRLQKSLPYTAESKWAWGFKIDFKI